MVGIKKGTRKKGNPDYEAYKDSKGVTRYRKRAELNNDAAKNMRDYNSWDANGSMSGGGRSSEEREEAIQDYENSLRGEMNYITTCYIKPATAYSIAETVADWEEGNIENEELVDSMKNISKEAGHAGMPLEIISDTLIKEEENDDFEVEDVLQRCSRELREICPRHYSALEYINKEYSSISKNIAGEDMWPASTAAAKMASRYEWALGNEKATRSELKAPMKEVWAAGEEGGIKRARALLKEKFPNGGSQDEYADYLESIVPERYRKISIDDAPSIRAYDRVLEKQGATKTSIAMSCMMLYSGINKVKNENRKQSRLKFW